MANRKQLAILKQGVAAWNKWREENPDAKINLRGAKLDRLNLSGANFCNADIRGASFRKASLVEANFIGVICGDNNSIAPLVLKSIGGVLSGWFIFFEFIIIRIYLIDPFYSENTISSNFVALFTVVTLTIIASIKRGNWILVTIFISIISTCMFVIIEKDSFEKIFLLIPILLICFALPWASILVSALPGYLFGLIIILLLSFTFSNQLIVIIINLSIIPLYVGLRIQQEDEQFSWLRNVRLILRAFFSTDFRKADLSCAIFDRAVLKYTRFGKVGLVDTSWRGARGLQLALCNGTILEDRDVRELLVRGNGQGLSLKGKKLQGAHLVNADLRSLDLRETDLMQANLSGANITGAKLYGSARENWIIDGIRCDYVYWDEAGEQRTPPDRNFRPGEFEDLYKQLPTFEYVFANGFTPLDPLIMDRVVQAVNERHKEFSLELVNFDKRGQPHATFTVCRLDYVEKAREQITAGYEANRIAPEKQEQLMDIISKLLDHNTLLAGNQRKSLDIIKQLGESAMGDTIYNISGGQIAAVGTNASASGNIFQQITADLSRLHEEMQRSAKTPEQRAAADDVAKAAQAAQQQNEPAVRQHLKNAGKFALDCAQKIGAEALAEYLKKMTLGM